MQRSIFLVGFMMLGMVTAAWAGEQEYSDPAGFSLKYPDGWAAVNRKVFTDATSSLPSELKVWIQRNNVDLSKIAVLILRKANETFLENLNVVVQGQQIPANDKAIQELSAAAKQQYAAMGVTINNYQAHLRKIANRDCIVIDYEARMPGVGETLRQRQVMIPGGGKTFIVTCTATPATFNTYEPVFETILASFQAPAPVATGINWNQTLTTGIVGGIIGGLVGLIMWAKNKFAAKPQSE